MHQNNSRQDITQQLPPPARSSKTAFALRILAGLILFGLALWGAEPQQLWHRASSAGWMTLLGGFLLILAGALPGSRAWLILCRTQGLRVSFRELLRLNLVGYFFNSYLPSGVGGHLWRGYALARQTGKTWPAVTATVLERVSAFASILILGGISLIVNHGLLSGAGIFPPVAGFMGLILTGFITGVALLPRLLEKLAWPPSLADGHPRNNLKMPAELWQKSLPALSAGAVINTLSQLAEAGAYWLLLSRIAPGIELLPILTLVPLLRFINHIPISWNSLGTQDLTMILFWGAMGLGQVEALSASMLMHALRLLTGGVGGVLYMVEGAGSKNSGKASNTPEIPE